MPLLDLSAELLFCVTSFLRQVDILNLSLTCKRINGITEPERFREYSNIKIDGRSLVPFIGKLLQRPELRKYVHRLNLRQWTTLEGYTPLTEYEELTQAEYAMLTEAAKTVGVITDIFPYEPESYIARKNRQRAASDRRLSRKWYTYAFDENIAFSDISYDRKFCQMLRIGIEDPLVILLIALLPNLKDIFLYGMPGDESMLAHRAGHQHKALRHLTARAVDGEVTWPLAFFNTLFATSKVEIFEASSASSWYKVDGEILPRVENVRPLSLRPGSLNIKWLELQFCCLTSSDLQILFDACPKLKVFRYSSGGEDVGPRSPSPAKMVELLKPFQETLEELWLDLDVDTYEDAEPRGIALITSMTHMTGLKRLSTTPEMWHVLEDHSYDEATGHDLPFERRLCLRLPHNLEQLWLQISENDEETSLYQLIDLIRNRSKLLPNLNLLHIGARGDPHIEYIEIMQEEEKEYLIGGDQPLAITVGTDQLASVFDTVVDSIYHPDLRWFGDKYAKRCKKHNGIFSQVLETLDSKYVDMDLPDFDEMHGSIRWDSDIESMMRRFKTHDGEGNQYESTDEE